MTLTDWTVVFAAEAADDLSLIETHLIRAYRDLGESRPEAARHAQTRIEAIILAAEHLSAAPLRGEAHEGLLPGLRHLALDGAIFWFTPDSGARQVRVLAVFFGSQGHRRYMLVRLLQKGCP
jgi:toxin ParE1/3/4